MAFDASEALDLSKENIQPLRNGRNAAQLKTALLAQTDSCIRQQLLRQREKYELLIRMYEGDDPLAPYYEYVSWLEQSYIKSGLENNLVTLLEDTLKRFKDMEKYKQDPRLIQIVVKYIHSFPDPLEIYQLVYNQGLGTMCSLLYKSWAEELDKVCDFKRADQIYQLGIKNRAVPLDDLKEAHVQFQLSIARRMIEGKIEDNIPEPKPQKKRVTLSNIKPSKVYSSRLNNRHTAGIMPSTNVNAPSAQKFKVYMGNEDDDVWVPSKSKSGGETMPNEGKVNRENVRKASTWSGQKLKQKVSDYGTPVTPTTPKFRVHEDPNATCDQVKTISKLQALKTRKEELKCPVAIFEEPDPTKKAMYPKHLVYAGGCDFSLEEIRAARYWKKVEKEGKQLAENQRIAEENAELNKTAAMDVSDEYRLSSLPSIPSSENKNPAFVAFQDDNVSTAEIVKEKETNPAFAVFEDNDVPAAEIRGTERKPEFVVFQDDSDSEIADVKKVKEPKPSFVVFQDDNVISAAEIKQAERKPEFVVFEDDSANTDAKDVRKKEPVKFSVYTDDENGKTEKPHAAVGGQHIKNDAVFDFGFPSPSASFTVHTKAAMAEIQRMWESPLSQTNNDFIAQPQFKVPSAVRRPPISFNPFSPEPVVTGNFGDFADIRPLDDIDRPLDALRPKASNFAVFDDANNGPHPATPGTPLPLVVPVNLADTPLEPEDKENRPPKTYVTPEPRHAFGILTPSDDIPYGDDGGETDEDDECKPHQVNYLDDETCTTRAFAIALTASTPFSNSEQGRAPKKLPAIDGSYISEEYHKSLYATAENKTGAVSQNLSLIKEASGESGSSGNDTGWSK